MIFRDFRRIAKQAYIKKKAFFDKKANASKLIQADYLYVDHPKKNYQGSIIPFTELQWFGSYITEKAFPKKNDYSVRRIETDKTRELHRMRLRHFTP